MLSWLLAILYCLMLIAPMAAISADDMLHRLGINVEGTCSTPWGDSGNYPHSMKSVSSVNSSNVVVNVVCNILN